MYFTSSVHRGSSGGFKTATQPAELAEMNFKKGSRSPAGACDEFEVDLSAKLYDVCVCGCKRSEHEEYVLKAMRRRSRIPFPPKAMLVKGKSRLRGMSYTLNPTFENAQEDSRLLSFVSNDDLLAISPQLTEGSMVSDAGATTGMGFYAAQGLRDYMEDTWAFKIGDRSGTQSMFAVFDGHGGSNASKYCAENMLKEIRDIEKRIILKRVLEEESAEEAPSALPQPSRQKKRTSILSRTLSSLVRVNSSSSVGSTSSSSKSTGGSYVFSTLMDPVAIQQAMIEAFQNLDSAYCNESMETGNEDGTTATVVIARKVEAEEVTMKSSYLSRRKTAKAVVARPINVEYYCACSGDSRAVLIPCASSADTRPVPLSEDHDVITNASERQRVTEKGGEKAIYLDASRGNIPRVKGRLGKYLGVTRAIGDAFFKPYVTATPEVQSGVVEVTPGSDGPIVVVASDGLWGVLSNGDVAEVVRGFQLEMGYSNPDRLEAVSKQLARLALRAGSDDNITVLVVDLVECC